MITAIDTSVIIAGVLAWHPHHARAGAAFASLGSARDVVLPAHALVEAYAVMTRLPAPHRLAAAVARDLLATVVAASGKVVALTGREHWAFVGGIAERGITGGLSYDALIVAAALRGGARRLLTFDASDFDRIAPPELEVVVP